LSDCFYSDDTEIKNAGDLFGNGPILLMKLLLRRSVQLQFFIASSAFSAISHYYKKAVLFYQLQFLKEN